MSQAQGDMVKGAFLVIFSLSCLLAPVGCGPQWKKSAAKGINLTAEGALSLEKTTRPAIKEVCDAVARTCYLQGRRTLETCKELNKCFTALRSVKLGTQTLLSLAREARMALELSDEKRTGMLVLKALETLQRLRETYDRIRQDVEKLSGAP